MEAANDDAGMEKMKADAGAGEEPTAVYRGWKAMPFVIGNETFEKLGTTGTLSNLLVYLTTVYHITGANAATILDVFSGTTNLATVLGAFLADAYLGRYATLAAACVASFLGMLVLTLTAAIRSLHPPPCQGSSPSSCRGPSPWQLTVLLASFVFLIAGAGGIRPCNLAFGADQFDPRTPSGHHGVSSFFNWYYFTGTVAMMISGTLVIYVQSNVDWAIGLAIPAALMAVSCALFFLGTRLYVRVRPEGSPFASVAQVLVAAARKRRLLLPADAPAGAGLFDPPHRSRLVSKIAYTDQFHWLDKAAMVTSQDELAAGEAAPANPWRLCTVQQVEEVKCLARMMPLWTSGIVYFVVVTQLGTYVVLQAMQTDRRIGRVDVPAGSFVVFQFLAIMLWIPVYDRLAVPALRRVTGRGDGISLLQRIGVGVALSAVSAALAAAVEWRRRSTAGSSPPGMSFLWLVPQQLLVGVSEAFAAIGQTEFYYKQFPENMRSAAGAFLFLAIAVAGYASGLMVAVVHRAMRGRDGRPDWLAQDLDQGRVDLFYLVVAAMGALNLVYFVLCARWYRSKKSDAGEVEANAEPV